MNTATLDHAAGAAAKHAGMQLALDYSGDWKDEILTEFRAWIAVQKARGRNGHHHRALQVAGQEPARQPLRMGEHARHCDGCRPDRAQVGRAGVQDRVRAASVRTHGHEVKCWAVL